MAFRILAFSGSLRAASTNTALLRTAQELLPEGVTLELYDYADVPLYNGDLSPVPEAATRLKAAVEAADALLIATPEFNHSIPGVLKNALDWGSRPAYHSPFEGKPTGVMSAAASFVGGARAQLHLKTIMLSMCSPVYPGPELLVGASYNLAKDGRYTDEATLGHLQTFLDGFVPWAKDQ